ncbi:Nectin-4 [Merluccius polli]|uniref:Nectin-4 n=1 Tax=Merluccius polli TaxID=89951 RepID=A0AA47MFF7_MERPO|nr:Nectin-4 [Merluccius polli]
MQSAGLLPVSVLLSLTAVCAQLSSYADLTADFGADVAFTCSLGSGGGAADIVQVSLLRRKGTVATYSKRFGEQIHDPRVRWTASTSTAAPVVTIRNVTWTDDACYTCTFSVYPTGSHSRHTCLRVQGISNIRTDVQQNQTQPRELVVSCTATGKPAPAVRWHTASMNLSEDAISQEAKENADKTFTVSSNLTLTASTAFVDCLVEGGAAGPRVERISLPVWSEKGHKEVDTEHGSTAGMIVGGIISVVIIGAIATVALKIQKRETGQQPKQGSPDFPLPSHFVQFFPGDPEAFPGQARDMWCV